MTDRMFYGCSLLLVLIVAALFTLGVRISNPPAKTVPSAPAAVASQTGPRTQAAPPLEADAYVLIPYEQAGGIGQLISYGIKRELNGRISVTPSSTLMQRASGRRFTTMGLAGAPDFPSAYWYVMDLASNQQSLVQYSPLQADGPLTETPIHDGSHVTEVLNLNREMFCVRARSPHDGWIHTIVKSRSTASTFPAPQLGRASLTPLIAVTDAQGTVLGAAFGSVDPAGVYLLGTNGQSQGQTRLRNQLFVQSLAVQQEHDEARLFAFGMTADGKPSVSFFRVRANQTLLYEGTRVLFCDPAPASAGIGHVFVHEEDGKRIASLFFWDDPFMRRFNLDEARQESSLDLSRFFEAGGTQLEVRQAVPLTRGRGLFAFTVQATQADASLASRLIVAVENGFHSFEALAISNGLAAGPSWIAWDTRSQGRNLADELVLIDLEGPLHREPLRIPMGARSPARPLPSQLLMLER